MLQLYYKRVNTRECQQITASFCCCFFLSFSSLFLNSILNGLTDIGKFVCNTASDWESGRVKTPNKIYRKKVKNKEHQHTVRLKSCLFDEFGFGPFSSIIFEATNWWNRILENWNKSFADFFFWQPLFYTGQWPLKFLWYSVIMVSVRVLFSISFIFLFRRFCLEFSRYVIRVLLLPPVLCYIELSNSPYIYIQTKTIPANRIDWRPIVKCVTHLSHVILIGIREMWWNALVGFSTSISSLSL